MLRDASTRNKPVAVTTDLRARHDDPFDQQSRPLQQALAQVGTTAEIMALKEEHESPYVFGPCTVVKLLGRQRFRLLDVRRLVAG